MLPGYLHFDVRRGLRADTLNAAMSALISDVSFVRKAFDSLGLTDISFTVNESAFAGLKGQAVHFYIHGQLITPNERMSTVDRSLSAKNSLWDKISTQPLPEVVASRCCNDLIFACLNGEKIPLKQLRDLFFAKTVKPSFSALALKILENLEAKAFIEQRLASHDALWLLCQLVMLCAQVDALDPKFISASTVFLSPDHDKEDSLFSKTWLNHVMIMMPIVESDKGCVADVLALAFLKTLSGQFGARGRSTILNVGIGVSSAGLTEALWCEADFPESIQEGGPSKTARLSSLFEVKGFVPAASDIAYLSSTLANQGARAMYWHLTYGEKHVSLYRVEFLCDENDKKDLIEALLIKGEAKDVITREVEHHEFHRRLVSIPIGSKNKTTSIRFYEYIYYDQTVRVEPLKEDLDSYVDHTNYSVDVARSDLLLMWKKWRGKVAFEDA